MTTDTLAGDRLRPDLAVAGAGEGAVDILGIGFGPANLSLAIAIEEANARRPLERRITARFVEAQPAFGWHDGMLLPGTTMQISFLKDLVSQRNPISSYTFLNYLHERGRLPDFINLKSFFPTRREFHDYLTWAAARVTLPVCFGTTATAINQAGGCFQVGSRTADGAPPRTITARNVVLGTGIRSVLPAGVSAGPRVFHNHQLLPSLAALGPRRHRAFLVVGAGQSAAEVAAYLHDTFPESEVHASIRRFGYTPSDDSPYANRIFDPASVDEFYTAPAELKQRLLDYHGPTNYSAVDTDLINDLYRREYDETVRGARRLVVHRVTEVEELQEGPDDVTVVLRDLGDRGATTLEVDAVVFATGFRAHDVRDLLGPTIEHRDAFEAGLPIVERDYRLRLAAAPGGIFLNGGVEHSHGLTSSLLSNVAIRAEEIMRAATDEHASSRT
jgi:L-ornithine N5-oxygenase